MHTRLLRLLGRVPFVTKPELQDLLSRDLKDIESQMKIDEDIRTRPRRGARPVPRNTFQEWVQYVAWLNAATSRLQNLNTPAELNSFVDEWQRERKDIVTLRMGWARRADVIPVVEASDG